MAYENYTTLSVQVRGRVAYATINNPPVNLITKPLFEDLLRLSLELEADDNLLVFVLRSANPEFFIAHFDVSSILEFPIEGEPKHEDYANAFYHDMCERYRLMNKVTIAQIEGRVGGGGSELAMSFDMRFGVRGKTFVNQMEVPLGILPGGRFQATCRISELTAVRSSIGLSASSRAFLSAFSGFKWTTMTRRQLRV